MSHLIAPPAILLSLASAASIYLISTSRNKKTTNKNSYSSLPTTSITSVSEVSEVREPKEGLNRDVEIDADSFYPKLRIQKLITILTLVLLEFEVLGELGYNSIEGLSNGIDEIKSLLIGDGLMALFTVSLSIKQQGEKRKTRLRSELSKLDRQIGRTGGQRCLLSLRPSLTFFLLNN